jgi:hypothetical protein
MNGNFMSFNLPGGLPPGMREQIDEIMKYKAQIISDFTKAYLAKSELQIDQIELVEDFSYMQISGQVVYYFREKPKPPAHIVSGIVTSNQ